MTSQTPDPRFEAGEFTRDVCWLGEDHPDFRDDYPLSFPPERTEEQDQNTSQTG